MSGRPVQTDKVVDSSGRILKSLESQDSAMNTIDSIDLIYRNPNIRGGRPCVVGTDLRVLDIVVAMIFDERTPDQLAQDYALSMAEVHAALSYYHGNKVEIDEDIREDIRIGLELAKEGRSLPEKSKLVQTAFDNSLSL